jgi:hypothetical protein
MLQYLVMDRVRASMQQHVDGYILNYRYRSLSTILINSRLTLTVISFFLEQSLQYTHTVSLFSLKTPKFF